MVRIKNFIPKITKEKFQEEGIHYCKCVDMCGQIIEWKDYYRHTGIPKYKKGHNLKLRTTTWTKGRHHTEETKKIQSNKSKMYNLEHPERVKMLQTINIGRVSGFKGRKQSKEACDKVSKANKGRPSILKGKKLSEEHCKKLSEAHIGLQAGVNSPHYGSHLSEERKRNHSNKMKGRFAGKKHPNWKGGISKLPYCDKFDEPLKEAVRNRDNRLCQLCGKDENKEKQSVHHIHYDKENCYPDLICLCRSCNSKVNYNRKYYENWFMNKLNERKLLLWTKKRLLTQV